MKNLTILLILFFSYTARTGEITGVGQQVLEVLKVHDLSLQSIEDQGMKVIFGELTGVGKKMHLDRIQMVVTKKKIFNMNDLTHIQFKNPSRAQRLKDVTILEFDQRKIKANQIKGLVYK